MSLADPQIPEDWGLEPGHRKSRQYNEQLGALARRLVKSFIETLHDREARKLLVDRYYRKFYTLTLSKEAQEVGLNRHPARDRVLDFPWLELEEDRFLCLKIWEKINQ
jgi:hypothetical protein